MGNLFVNGASSNSRGAYSEHYIDWNGFNTFKMGKGSLQGFPDGAGAKPQRNLWHNQEFVPDASSIPWGVGSIGNAAFTRTAVSTLTKDIATDQTYPQLGRMAMTLTADGVGIVSVQMYVAANNIDTDSTVNMPENSVRHMVQREDLRGQELTVGAWVYFEGTQGQLDSAGDIGLGVAGPRDVKLTIANKWVFLTCSQLFLDDFNFSSETGNRVLFQLRSVSTVASGVKIHIASPQFCRGQTVSSAGTPAVLETAVGGVIYGDTFLAESDSAANTALLNLNGVYIWGVSGTIRISTTRPTNLATDGAAL